MNLRKELSRFLTIRQSISPRMRLLLAEEEKNGAFVANRFRYVIGGVLTVSAIANIPNMHDVWGYVINFAGLAFYFLNTFVHAYLLKCNHTYWQEKYEYISLFFDNFLVSITMWNWYLLQGGGNPNFNLKTPLIFYYFLPLSLSLFQFRIRLVAFSFFCFLVSYFFFLSYAVASNSKMGTVWFDYVLSDELILSDAIVSKPLVYLVVTLSLSYGIYRTIVMLKRLADSEAQKNSLSRYFSPDLVEEITSKPDVISFGQRQKVTVLFSDIRGFTQLSESMDPAALSVFLTEYRKGMTKAIFNYEGTLDKFIGDAVMATFGTPLPAKLPGLDSKNAVLSAKEMFIELDKFNSERISRGESPIEIGIGIHSGEVFAGNIGSEERMEYTVIGDTVNTASRIESACKELGSRLLISEEVWEEVGRPEDFERTRPVALAGKEKRVELFSWKEKI